MTIVYCTQAFLSTVAILAVLIGIKTLPLCYLIIGLSLTHLVITAIGNLENTRMRDSTTFLGLVLAVVTAVCAFSCVRLLNEPETIATKLKDINWDDPLI